MGSTQTVAMNAATAEANLAASSVGAPTAAVTESPVAEDVQTGTAAAAAPVSAPAVTDADARALFAANSETQARSEERRVGKEGVSTGRARWAPDNKKKKQ